MRTTFSPEPDVECRVREIASKTGKSMSSVINDLLKVALRMQAGAKQKPFEVKTFSLALKPGVNEDRLKDYLCEEDLKGYDPS